MVGKDCAVGLDAHFYDILRIAGEHKLQIVAVLSEEQRYIGVITVQDIMTSFAQTASVQMQGGILYFPMDLVDYSLAEISRYIEENNAKVISSTMIEDPWTKGRIKLTLKINQLDLAPHRRNARALWLSRYSPLSSQPYRKHDKERIDMLMRY